MLKKLIILFFSLFFLILIDFFTVRFAYDHLKKYIPYETKIKIVKYFLPYKYINQLEKDNQSLLYKNNTFFFDIDLKKKKKQ